MQSKKNTLALGIAVRYKMFDGESVPVYGIRTFPSKIDELRKNMQKKPGYKYSDLQVLQLNGPRVSSLTSAIQSKWPIQVAGTAPRIQTGEGYLVRVCRDTPYHHEQSGKI